MTEYPPSSTFPGLNQNVGAVGFWDINSTKPPITVKHATPHDMFYDPPTNGMSMCKILMYGIIILVIWWLVSKSSCTQMFRPVSHAVNGMKAAIAGNSITDHHVKVDVATVKKSKVHNLTPCTNESCRDIKKIDAKTKISGDKAVDKFVKDHETCMLFIYAPWCPHCVTAMPKYYEASTKADVAFGIINAEMVSPELLHGEKSAFNVEFFPHIMRLEKQKDGTMNKSLFKEAANTEAIVKHSKKGALAQFFS